MNSNIWRTIVLALSLVWCLTMVPFVQASQQTNPDSTGYRWIDNKQPGPSIIYEWIEISAIGTDLLAAPGGLDLNDGSIGITTPFLPTLYGSLYGINSAPIYVSINGLVSFGTPLAGPTSAYNTPLPTNSAPNNIIAVFWDDLDASSGGHIYYAVIGTAPNRKIVIQWSNMAFNGQTANLNFQLQILETETATPYYLVYGNMTSPDAARATGSDATIGVENSTGTKGTQYSHNQPNVIVSNDTIIGFIPPQDLFGTPKFVKGAGCMDHARILWGLGTPSMIALHFFVYAPIEEGIEITGLEISASLPDDPAALDLDESKYIQGINIIDDVDRNADISNPEQQSPVYSWTASPQQTFTNNGKLSLTIPGQTVIATASRAFIVQLLYNTTADPAPLEGMGFKMKLDRVSYRGLLSNASRIQTLDYETGSVYVDDGINPFGSLSVMTYNYDSTTIMAVSGGQAVAMAFKVTIGNVEDIRWETLVVRGLSTGNINTDIQSVTFYRDQNVNGKFETGEPVAGTAFAFGAGDMTTINAPLGQDFLRGTINYYLAVITFRNATDLSMMNTTHQLVFQFQRTYLNMSYFTTPRLLGGTIVGASFQARVQEFPKPAVLCIDAVGRTIRIGNQQAINIDPTGTSLEGGGCFIATAAFGSYTANAVVDLCNFRDREMSFTQSGESLVGLYYAVSPELAATLRRSKAIRGLMSDFLGESAE